MNALSREIGGAFLDEEIELGIVAGRWWKQFWDELKKTGSQCASFSLPRWAIVLRGQCIVRKKTSEAVQGYVGSEWLRSIGATLVA